MPADGVLRLMGLLRVNVSSYACVKYSQTSHETADQFP